MTLIDNLSPLANGGILTWTPIEWGIGLTTIFGAIVAFIAALYPWWSRYISDIRSLKQARIDDKALIDTNTNNATNARIAAEVAKALAEQQKQDNHAIRRDLTITQLATNTTVPISTLSAVSEAIDGQTPQLQPQPQPANTAAIVEAVRENTQATEANTAATAATKQ